MTPGKAREMLFHFFGQQAVTVFDPLWPETMLLLAPGAGRDEVLAALRWRLTQIDQHADRGSEQARTLETLLKSVAAQMISGPGEEWTEHLDEALRQSGVPVRRRATNDLGATRAEIPGEDFESFKDAALSQLAAEGMRDDSLPRLHMLAAMHGLPASAVDQLLVDLQYHLPAHAAHVVPDAPSARARVEAAPVEEYDEPIVAEKEHDLGRVLILFGGGAVFLALLVGAAIALYALLSPSTPTTAPAAGGTTNTTPPAQAIGTSSVTEASAPSTDPSNKVNSPHPLRLPEPPTPGATPEPVAPTGPIAMPDPQVLLRDLRAAVKSGTMTPADRIKRLAPSVAKFRAWWPRLDPNLRTAASEAIVEGAYLVSNADEETRRLYVLMIAPVTDAAVSGLTLAPERVWSDAAGAGLLTRVLRERELPRPLAQVIEDELAAAIGGTSASGSDKSTFAGGVLAFLRASPLRLVASNKDGPLSEQQVENAGKSAERWHAALAAVLTTSSNIDPQPRIDTHTLEAIERLLVDGPELLENRTAFEVVSRLLARVPMREGDTSRDRLLQWLGDQRISIGDMHVVTSAMATRSGSAAVAPNMVLAASATPADRDTLRAEYAQAWSLSRSSGGTIASREWVDRAKDILRECTPASDDLEHLTATVMLARLNQAAALRHRGQPANVPAATPLSSGASGSVTSKALLMGKLVIMAQLDNDGEWARRYLGESRTPAARLARVRELNERQLGPIDSEVLMEIALTASGELRSAAQEAAIKHSHEAAMINAAIEWLPRTPRSVKNALFLANLTGAGQVPPGSEHWSSHYRRALVEKFLEVAAASNYTAAADRAAGDLADAYCVACGDESTAITEQDGPRFAVDAAERLYRHFRSVVSTPGASAPTHAAVEATDQRHDGRVMVSVGLVQRFAAHQASAAEMLALAVASERPSVSADTQAIIVTMNQARRGATSVTQQMHAVEEAMARLWALRSGESL